MWVQILAGFAAALFIAWGAWKLNSLSTSGAVATTILGTIVFGLGGLGWAVLLLGFFISSSLLSKFAGKNKRQLSEKFAKGSRRDVWQVLANGGVAGVFVLLSGFLPDTGVFWLAFAASLAAVNADTWATELGVLSKKPPRLLTTFKIVDPGTSGAVSVFGTLTSLGGAVFIALLSALFPMGGTPLSFNQGLARVLLISLAGLIGSLVDSALGSTVQAIYHCPKCEKDTERHPAHICGTKTTHHRGLRWLGNDLVNTACAISSSVLTLIAALLIPGCFGL